MATRSSLDQGPPDLTARDLKGNLLLDKTGGHIFRIENGLIRRFDIR